MQLTAKQIARFWSRINKGGPDDCWPWTGTTAGYHYRRVGRFWVGSEHNRKGYMAHRLAAQLMGIDIGSDHLKPLCGNDLCCNPRHQVYSRSGVALVPEPAYNRKQRNEFPLSADVDAFRLALLPLKDGKAVVLTMDDPRVKVSKNYRGTKAVKTVVIVPGEIIGARHSILVSVLGSGSCVIHLDDPKVANLVLAGMPAKLANVLTAKVRQIFQE